MIETARKEDLFLDKKLIIPENRLDAIRIMARLHPVVGDQPANEKDQPNTNNPVLDLACTILNIHESGVGVHADLRKIQNEPPKYFYGKGFMSGISNLKGNGILAVYGHWQDGSGRYAIKQFYYTDKEIVWRNAISDTAWSQWFDVLTSNSDLDYNKLLNVPITSTLSDSKTQIASIFAVNNVNRAAVNAQKTANRAQSDAADAMNEAKSKMAPGDFGLGVCEIFYNANPDDYWGGFRHGQMQSLAPDVIRGTKRYAALISFNATSSSFASQLQVSGTSIEIRDKNSGWTAILTQNNTVSDSKGVIHSGTKTPVDVLLEEDHGLASSTPATIDINYLDHVKTGFSANFGALPTMPTGSKSGVVFKRGWNITQLLYATIANELYMTTIWGDRPDTTIKFYGDTNTTTDPAGFLRSFGNAVALTTDKLTSDLKVNRSDLVASAKYAYDVYQAALAADKKAANAQARADSAFSKVKPISEGGTGATTAANARKNLGHGDASTRNVATSLESNGNTLVPLSLMNNSMFGVGQKWVDVTGQRMSKSTYKNDTGKPICLSLWMKQEWQGSKVFTVFIDGINVVRSDTGTSSDPSVFAIIPAGSTYKVEIDGVSLGANAFWFEMR